MKCARACPVARPVALTATSHPSSGYADSWSAVPTTLLTCPSVGTCCGRCSFPTRLYLRGDQLASSLDQWGGVVACPLALGCFIRLPSQLHSSTPPLPANEGVNLVAWRRLDEEGRP